MVMSTIAILGGTGYTGAHIAREAAGRGHQVIAWSRTAPETPIPGVAYRQGTFLDEATVEAATAGVDVVIAALSPRGELEGRLEQVYRSVSVAAAAAGARLGVVGGFGSHRLAAGAERIAYGADFPAEYAGEARELASVLDALQSDAPSGLSWFFISPAQVYGAYVPGERTGTYRSYGEVPEFDADGQSVISGDDFAIAVVDEIETPAHHDEHFGVAH